ncbi:unnamed protein product, partial [marine sediment metagenome]
YPAGAFYVDQFGNDFSTTDSSFTGSDGTCAFLMGIDAGEGSYWPSYNLSGAYATFSIPKGNTTAVRSHYFFQTTCTGHCSWPDMYANSA